MASKNSAQEYPIQVLREKLRRQSSEQADKLTRSVGRLRKVSVIWNTGAERRKQSGKNF